MRTKKASEGQADETRSRKRLRRQRGVRMLDEHGIGAVPVNPREEVRVSVHRFMGRRIVNIRKFALTSAGWAHTPCGIFLGETVFPDVLALLNEIALDEHLQDKQER